MIHREKIALRHLLVGGCRSLMSGSSLCVYFVLLFLMVSTGSIVARETGDLLDGWRFQLGETANAAQSVFDDHGWQTISIPHCWGWEQAQKGDTNYYRGPGWYRRGLDVKPVAGRRYFLRFEAASLVADVFLNGQSLGEHRGGFGAFCFEITTNLSSSGTNLLAVRVSNAKASDIAPLAGDFPVYGGLYRPVHLIETGADCFALTDHGSPGVCWMQTSVTDTQAVLDVTAEISNPGKKQTNLTLTARVVDATGKTVLASNVPLTLAASVTAPYFLRLTMANPHLWNGRQDPYLYHAIIELRSNDTVLDAVEQPLGLRYYRVDPELGFFLNGKPYPLHGVCRHQDRWDKGWAVSEADLAEDVSMIKDIGANVVRCAHYQHSDYFYRLCDEAGILVWTEIPQVNTVLTTPEFEAASCNQLLDLIRQNVNHPSIFVWSLGNEIGNGFSEDPHGVLQDLNAVAHGEDSTRPTVAAICGWTLTKFPQSAKIPDLLGWNIYPGWYRDLKTMNSFTKWLDEQRATSRQGGIALTEYGAGANPQQHEQNPSQPIATGQWHPEEWQALVHEADWAAIQASPFVWGSFVWNMFDFVSPERREGDRLGLNDKGLVTADRKIKKDAFYFYQANWSAEPVLHLTSRRFTARTNEVTNVKVYSNTREVELFINGVSQGRRADGVNCVFNWPAIRLQPGENRIEVRGEKNGQELNDHCVWVLSSAAAVQSTASAATRPTINHEN